MVEIIIKGKTNLGKTRSEQEENLRKEWGNTMSDENLDKCRHIEKKFKELTGAERSKINQSDIADYFENVK